MTQLFSVLCVDDEPDILVELSELISRAGFKPMTALSVMDGIKKLEQCAHETVAVISDYSMPDANGLDFRSMCLDRWKDIPFILVSAHITREMALQGIERKIAAFIDKPYQPDMLIATLKKEAQPLVELFEEKRILRGIFVEEAVTQVSELEPLLLQFEENPSDKECANHIFRLVHTMKGSSGVIELPAFTKFLHHFEDVLSKIKSGKLEATDIVMASLVAAFDKLSGMVDQLEKGDFNLIGTDLSIFSLESKPTVHADTPAVATQGLAPAIVKTTKKREYLQVPTEILDEFMNLSGEVTVIRNMVKKIVSTLERTLPANNDINLLAELLEEMNKINAQMQSKITDLRKVPLGSVFKTLPRAVRDLSRSLNKNVKLTIENEDLRVDMPIVQALANSLIHMVRNCVDHGIESIEKRQKNGKDPQGCISISAREENDKVYVVLQDDGGGINLARVKEKALEKQLMPADTIERMSDKQLCALIFEAGFSTATTVTEVSGRGVGMDMVRSSVESLNGSIDIQTHPGQGTTFTFILPMQKSVLIINSLIVSVGDSFYAIAQEHVGYLVQVHKDNGPKRILELPNSEALNDAEHLLPIVSAADVLGLTDRKKEKDVRSFVVIHADGKKFALEVDEIVDSEDVVVKPLEPWIGRLGYFAGASFMADGSVGLILDTKHFGRSVEESQTSASGTEVSRQKMCFYALCDIGWRSAVAIPLHHVHRLEVVEATSLRHSGEARVLIYRESLMPVVSLAHALQLPNAANTQNDSISLVVSKTDLTFVGFEVKTVLDIVSLSADVSADVRDRPFMLGNLVFENRAFPVLNLEQLARTLSAKQSKLDPPSHGNRNRAA